MIKLIYALFIISAFMFSEQALATEFDMLPYQAIKVTFNPHYEPGVTKWVWTFNGGNPASAVRTVKGYAESLFPGTGEYTIKLVTTKNGIESEKLKRLKIDKIGVSIADILVTDNVFATSSFWYTPIPANTPLHASSTDFVTEFLRQKTAYYGTVSINTSSYASPIYYATTTAPRSKVTEWNCQNKSYFPDAGLAKQWESVPIPYYAIAAGGTDQEMSIYDRFTNSLYEFWKAKKVGDSWQACWGGKISNASSSDGIFPSYYGTTATSLPFIGGQITAEELQRGEIRHAIGIALVDAAHWNIFSWPAHRSDGWNPANAANRIPEGLRFRLDPTYNVDASSLHPVAKTIAKTAQKYGFVVWDKAGAISIRAQNPTSYTALGKLNPYVALFDGTPSYAILNGFPWDKLQFLPMNYGKP